MAFLQRGGPVGVLCGAHPVGSRGSIRLETSSDWGYRLSVCPVVPFRIAALFDKDSVMITGALGAPGVAFMSFISPEIAIQFACVFL